MKLFKELFQYREFLHTSVKKEIRGKYKASFLGVLWSFVNPLLQVLVYAIVFPYIMRIKTDNYLIFLITGIIPWNWFTTVVSQGSGVFIYNSNLIKKVYFPRVIMPLSIVTSGLVNFLISCLIILIFVLFSGVGITWHLVFLPLIALVQYLFSLAIVLVISAVNVYIRDVEYIVNFFLQMGFYATPILYTTTAFSGIIVWMFRLNPMAHVINAYRDIFYLHNIPQLSNLFIVGLVSLGLVVLAYLLFNKLEKRFAEEL